VLDNASTANRIKGALGIESEPVAVFLIGPGDELPVPGPSGRGRNPNAAAAAGHERRDDAEPDQPVAYATGSQVSRKEP